MATTRGLYGTGKVRYPPQPTRKSLALQHLRGTHPRTLDWGTKTRCTMDARVGADSNSRPIEAAMGEAALRQE